MKANEISKWVFDLCLLLYLAKPASLYSQHSSELHTIYLSFGQCTCTQYQYGCLRGLDLFDFYRVLWLSLGSHGGCSMVMKKVRAVMTF